MTDDTEHDLWYEGYGAGLSGRTWVQVVMGRYLTQHERAVLANGWRYGLEDRANYADDMEAMEATPLAPPDGACEAPDEEIPW